MSQLQTIAVIQARMGSSRLPGKVIQDICGQPMLVRVVERTRRAKAIDQVVIATSDVQEDEFIFDLCQDHGYACFRGNLYDVLDRYYQTAKFYCADIVVRITGDCPVIDPGVIDITINALKTFSLNAEPPIMEKPAWDFAANRLPPPWGRTYPIGLDTEVCTMSALERAWLEADQPYQREHVMPYIYDPVRSVHFSTILKSTYPKQIPEGYFRILKVDHEPDFGNLRWTVDTQEDLDLLRTIYNYFDGSNDFSWLDVLQLYQERPELNHLNASVQHKSLLDVDERNLEP